MKFNHSKLLGRIRECGFTHKSLAKTLGISASTLSAKVNNKNVFTATEIASICRTLNIAKHDIDEYFFVEIV